MIKAVGMFALLFSIACLSACTSQEELALENLREQARQVETRLSRLAEHIDKGHIANTRKLQQYANILKSSTDSPEMRELIDTLALDATSKGAIFSSLQYRLEDAKQDIKSVKGLAAMDDLSQELFALSEASQVDNFAWMLTDPLNVLADMSNGRLARVEAMSKEASLRANKAQDYGSGSQLVGNPNYGSWQSNSSGQSFWAWYGQYAFFSSLFQRPIYYDNWARHRDYSYYHSAGRYQYTSPKQRRAQQKVQQKTEQKFKKTGKSFSSPYARTKTGSSRASAQAKRAGRSFQSGYARSASVSKKRLGSSMSSVNSRNSFSRNSRSYSSRGK